MTATNNIKQRIDSIPLGQPFSSVMFLQLASYANIRQVLSRMAQKGEIKRLVQGVFVKPEVIDFVGEVLPSAYSVVKAVAENTGEIIAEHGAETARRLLLTTQVPIRPIFYTSGTSRKLKVKNQIITLQHVSAKKLLYVNTTAGDVLSALDYLGRNNVTDDVLVHIAKQIGGQEFKNLFTVRSAMPVWLRNKFEQFSQKY